MRRPLSNVEILEDYRAQLQRELRAVEAEIGALTAPAPAARPVVATDALAAGVRA
jgi:hypothetical protein